MFRKVAMVASMLFLYYVGSMKLDIFLIFSVSILPKIILYNIYTTNVPSRLRWFSRLNIDIIDYVAVSPVC